MITHSNPERYEHVTARRPTIGAKVRSTSPRRPPQVNPLINAVVRHCQRAGSKQALNVNGGIITSIGTADKNDVYPQTSRLRRIPSTKSLDFKFDPSRNLRSY